MLGQRPPIYKVPNELLTYIVECVGPPDLARADPGWLVCPAVCKWWRDVAERVPDWKAGCAEDTNGNRTTYARVDLLPEHDLNTLDPITYGNTNTPLRSMMEMDNGVGVFCGIRPTWKGGAACYVDGFLSAFTMVGDLEHRRDLTAYLRPTPGQPPLINFAWVTCLIISCVRGDTVTDEPGYSFADVPCIVAPALQKLNLYDYIIDWRCNGLVSLEIGLDRLPTGENPAHYHYPPGHLLARLSESRHTLEDIELYNCFPAISRDANDTPTSPIVHFPSINTFIVFDNPRVGWWFHQHVVLRPGIQPALMAPWQVESEVSFLCSVACEHAQSVHDSDKSSTHGSHGVIETLSFYESQFYDGNPSRCSIKGYTPSTLAMDRDLDATHVKTSSAHSSTALTRTVSSSASTSASEPAFTIYACWDINAWTLPEIPASPACCSALHGVTQVFVHGGEGLFSSGRNSGAIWTEILVHLPNLRTLYIDAPSTRSLMPLASRDLIPSLETLWLRGIAGEGTHEVNVKDLVRVLQKRMKIRHRSGRAFELHLENIRLVGDAKWMQSWRELGGVECV
ncbi:hypothetical protein PENSPDRAFT_647314 [Peniophora sp. CONT]|nr:hypothetical protein PENSPDRAFT_647314 [Peniophora sp. CONT]